MAGDSLFVLPNEQWRPRKRALQPVFTKQNVRYSVAICPARHRSSSTVARRR